MATIRTNGKTYDGGDVIINLLGNVANEVSEISYSEKTAHQNNHYLGNRKPGSFSVGNTEYTASISMSMREQVAIENGIKGTDKRLVLIAPFWITVRYIDDFNVAVTDKILVKFVGQGRKMNVSSMGEAMQHELHCMDQQYNV